MTALALWLTPHYQFITATDKFRTRNPAPPPTSYESEGHRTPWRPPTRSGKFLSAEEYEKQGKMATDNALTQLFNSPVHAKWMMQNHHKMKWGEGDGKVDASEDD